MATPATPLFADEFVRLVPAGRDHDRVRDDIAFEPVVAAPHARLPKTARQLTRMQDFMTGPDRSALAPHIIGEMLS